MYKLCPQCQTMHELKTAVCPRCGHQFRTQFDQPSPVKMRVRGPRNLYISIAGICLIVTAVAFAFNSVKQRIQFSKPDLQPQTIQEKGTIVFFMGDTEGCPVAQTPEDFKALMGTLQPYFYVLGDRNAPRRTEQLFDKVSLQSLLASGRVFFVHQRTSVRVLDRTEKQVHVQVLEGVNTGRTGWIGKSMFFLPGQPTIPHHQTGNPEIDRVLDI